VTCWELADNAALYHCLQTPSSASLRRAAAPLPRWDASSSLPAAGSEGGTGAGWDSLGLNWAKYRYSRGSFTYVCRSNKMSL